jgi:hypothetical protein
MDITDTPITTHWTTLFSVDMSMSGWKDSAIRLYDDDNRIERVVSIETRIRDLRAYIYLADHWGIEVLGRRGALGACFVHQRFDMHSKVPLPTRLYLGHLIEDIADAIDRLWLQYRSTVGESTLRELYQTFGEDS